MTTVADDPRVQCLQELLGLLLPVLHSLREEDWATSILETVSWLSWVKQRSPESPANCESKMIIVVLDQSCDNVLSIQKYQAYNCLHKCNDIGKNSDIFEILLHYAFLFLPYCIQTSRYTLNNLCMVNIDDHTLFEFLCNDKFVPKIWATYDEKPIEGSLRYALCAFELEHRINLSKSRFEILCEDPALRIQLKHSDTRHQQCNCYFIRLLDDPLISSIFWVTHNHIRGTSHAAWVPIQEADVFFDVRQRSRTINKLCEEKHALRHYTPSTVGFNVIIRWLWFQKNSFLVDSGLRCEQLQKALKQPDPPTLPMCPSGSCFCKNGDPIHYRTYRHTTGSGPFSCFLPPSPQQANDQDRTFIAYATVCILVRGLGTYHVALRHFSGDFEWTRFLPGLDSNIVDTARRSLPVNIQSHFNATQCKNIDIVHPNFPTKNTKGYAYRVYLLPFYTVPGAVGLTNIIYNVMGIADCCVFLKFITHVVLPFLQGGIHLKPSMLVLVTNGKKSTRSQLCTQIRQIRSISNARR